VLDVGCGDGMLAADLVEAGIPHVVGLDIDQPVLDRARARHEGRGIDWRRGDLLATFFEPESFDAVVSVAALHHMDAARALARCAQLVRPGGTVAIVGMAAYEWSDLPLVAIGAASKLVLGVIRGRWSHTAPRCWPPPVTYREMRTISARALPGVRYRRHWLNRYSLVWRKPGNTKEHTA